MLHSNIHVSLGLKFSGAFADRVSAANVGGITAEISVVTASIV
jgi:hypothetical protein